MKVLLTSNGLANDAIRVAYEQLLPKPAKEMRAVFITTASNIESDDKTWLVNDISRFHALGFESFDLLDISGLESNEWLPRIESADAVVVGGGDSFHLLGKVHASGAYNELCALLLDRVYAGISAGSIAAAPNLSVRNAMEIFPDEAANNNYPAFGLVDFYFIPHLNSPDFPKSREEVIGGLVAAADSDIRTCDDATAIVVDGEKLTVVGTGVNFHFTKP